ncbi:MAG: hypothetical protein HYT76_09335 [Deltaproteobacteria bacterium]|nr:hypothetical protein [Deltaproteobacteria bacterium]
MKTPQKPSERRSRVLVASCLLLFCFLFTTGAGPILVDTEQTGLGVSWQDRVVRYNPESGAEAGLGRLSNEETLAILRSFFEEWQKLTLNGIAVANFSVVEGQGLGSVTPDNLKDHFSYCPPTETCPTEDPPFVLGSARTGQSPILFDTDGEITDLIHGEGAKESIIGFAGPRVIERVEGFLFITEGQAVLNGLFIDCPEGAKETDSCQDPEVTLEEFEGAIFHEIGHFIGLDHTQVNLSSAVKALSGDKSEVAGIPTMFPLLIDGKEQRSPHFDDIVSLALLYPSSALGTSFCTLQGKVFQADGITELQGVNVVAKRGDNPLLEATSFVSGQLYVGSSENCEAKEGDFTIKGLSPGVSYQLEIEKISSAFTGGSSIEPCDPPQSGFQATSVPGTFACSSGGEVIITGTQTTTDIVTTKGTQKTTDSSPDAGGCALIPLTFHSFAL